MAENIYVNADEDFGANGGDGSGAFNIDVATLSQKTVSSKSCDDVGDGCDGGDDCDVGDDGSLLDLGHVMAQSAGDAGSAKGWGRVFPAGGADSLEIAQFLWEGFSSLNWMQKPAEDFYLKN